MSIHFNKTRQLARFSFKIITFKIILFFFLYFTRLYRPIIIFQFSLVIFKHESENIFTLLRGLMSASVQTNQTIYKGQSNIMNSLIKLRGLIEEGLKFHMIEKCLQPITQQNVMVGTRKQLTVSRVSPVYMLASHVIYMYIKKKCVVPNFKAQNLVRFGST